MEPTAATFFVPLLLALSAGASVQQPELPPGAKAKVLDLAFKVEDFGATTADLAVKETDTELRIELAADVLFDFDRDTLQPAAKDTLAKAASAWRLRITPRENNPARRCASASWASAPARSLATRNRPTICGFMKSIRSSYDYRKSTFRFSATPASAGPTSKSSSATPDW